MPSTIRLPTLRSKKRRSRTRKERPLSVSSALTTCNSKRNATMSGLEAFALMRPHAVVRYWDRPSTGDWAKVLATFPLFSGLSMRQLRKLVGNATVAEFAPGDPVISSGDTADSLYVILGGAAKVLRKPTARELNTGDYFGELALIDGAPRSANRRRDERAPRDETAIAAGPAGCTAASRDHTHTPPKSQRTVPAPRD